MAERRGLLSLDFLTWELVEERRGKNQQLRLLVCGMESTAIGLAAPKLHVTYPFPLDDTHELPDGDMSAQGTSPRMEDTRVGIRDDRMGGDAEEPFETRDELDELEAAFEAATPPLFRDAVKMRLDLAESEKSLRLPDSNGTSGAGRRTDEGGSEEE